MRTRSQTKNKREEEQKLKVNNSDDSSDEELLWDPVCGTPKLNRDIMLIIQSKLEKLSKDKTVTKLKQKLIHYGTPSCEEWRKTVNNSTVGYLDQEPDPTMSVILHTPVHFKRIFVDFDFGTMSKLVKFARPLENILNCFRYIRLPDDCIPTCVNALKDTDRSYKRFLFQMDGKTYLRSRKLFSMSMEWAEGAYYQEKREKDDQISIITSQIQRTYGLGPSIFD